MKIRDYDGSTARAILSAMATDDITLGRIAAEWNGHGDYFSSPWENLVAGWCVKHHRKHQSAPRKGLIHLFEGWSAKGGDKDTASLVEKFLVGLSDEYEQQSESINPSLLIEMAGNHFNRVKLQRLKESIDAKLESNDITKGLEEVAAFHGMELGAGAGVDFYQNEEAVISHFDNRSEKDFVIYPGALGDHFRGTLGPDCFISFLAPEKTGKTFMLLDIAHNAVTQRNRTAFFSVGDMSERQIAMRFYSRMASKPFRLPAGCKDWPVTIKIPINIKPPPATNEPAQIEFKEKTFNGPLTAEEAIQAMKRIASEKIKSNKSWFRHSCHPNSSINVDGIRSILQRWAVDGWVPKVVVIDYADILAPPPGRMETRDQINTTWKQLRALSQELHILVVTATQADAESYDRATLDRRNFSEDKRKLSHATGICGINMTSREKDVGASRLNWIVLREKDYSPYKGVHVARCLALANPAVISCWP